MKILGVIILTLLVMSVAQAKTYKWVDTDGKIHYSDQPPPASIKKVENRTWGKTL